MKIWQSWFNLLQELPKSLLKDFLTLKVWMVSKRFQSIEMPQHISYLSLIPVSINLTFLPTQQRKWWKKNSELFWHGEVRDSALCDLLESYNNYLWYKSILKFIKRNFMIFPLTQHTQRLIIIKLGRFWSYSTAILEISLCRSWSYLSILCVYNFDQFLFAGPCENKGISWHHILDYWNLHNCIIAASNWLYWRSFFYIYDFDFSIFSPNKDNISILYWVRNRTDHRIVLNNLFKKHSFHDLN